jgi:hypothetical protein
MYSRDSQLRKLVVSERVNMYEELKQLRKDKLQYAEEPQVVQ